MQKVTFVLKCVTCKRKVEVASESIDPVLGPDCCSSCLGPLVVESVKVQS